MGIKGYDSITEVKAAMLFIASKIENYLSINLKVSGWDGMMLLEFMAWVLLILLKCVFSGLMPFQSVLSVRPVLFEMNNV